MEEDFDQRTLDRLRASTSMAPGLDIDTQRRANAFLFGGDDDDDDGVATPTIAPSRQEPAAHGSNPESTQQPIKFATRWAKDTDDMLREVLGLWPELQDDYDDYEPRTVKPRPIRSSVQRMQKAGEQVGRRTTLTLAKANMKARAPAKASADPHGVLGTEDHNPARTGRKAEYNRVSVLAQRLGFDFGSNGLPMPTYTGQYALPLYKGWNEANTRHAGTRGKATCAPHVHRWLLLRLSALTRDIPFHDSVTPLFLQSIAASFCPVLRTPIYDATLSSEPTAPENALCVDRLDDSLGYVMGNLVCMSAKANMAKGDHIFEDFCAFAALARASSDRLWKGLSFEEWERMAHLASVQLPKNMWRLVAPLPMRTMLPANLFVSLPLSMLQSEISRLTSMPEYEAAVKKLASRFDRWAIQKLVNRACASFREAYDSAREASQVGPWMWIAEDAWCDPALAHDWSELVRAMEIDDLHQIVQGCTAPIVHEADWNEMNGFNAQQQDESSAEPVRAQG